jgi:flagellar biosynthesis protein FlhG
VRGTPIAAHVVPDQAAALRELMRPPAAAGRLARTRVIAVSSGKGGVGKTTLTVNLAIALAGRGRKAIVLDGDLGLANVAVTLGLAPRATLEHVIAGRRALADVLTPAPGGFWIIPGGSGLEELANLSDERRRHLIGSLAQLDGRADVLLIDTGAGISTEVSAFLAAAPELLVVTTPEPTAITDAYALIKVASRASPATGAGTIRLVVNQVNDVGEAREVARKITLVAREFLSLDLELLGHVPADPYVGRAIRRQAPILLSYPSSPASLAIARLGDRLIGQASQVDGNGSSIMTFLRRMAGFTAPATARQGVP